MKDEGGKLQPRVERISKICNNNLPPKQLMKQIYAESMELLMGSLKKQCETAESRTLLELGYFAHHAQQLKKSAADRPDFNKYYE